MAYYGSIETVAGRNKPYNGLHVGSIETTVIAYYSKKGAVVNLQAEKPPKEVTTEVQKALL
ncbi:Adenylate kinase A [Dendrobium catenatum]|uniref:Adenylate kinase A n=1 Tax=Dendrobium catenatum TaxID=906689 RepID=A0A2I0VUY4_9ASPA|nr:Adenylate kinase A [Dendrobium catenatum]